MYLALLSVSGIQISDVADAFVDKAGNVRNRIERMFLRESAFPSGFDFFEDRYWHLYLHYFPALQVLQYSGRKEYSPPGHSILDYCPSLTLFITSTIDCGRTNLSALEQTHPHLFYVITSNSCDICRRNGREFEFFRQTSRSTPTLLIRCEECASNPTLDDAWSGPMFFDWPCLARDLPPALQQWGGISGLDAPIEI